VLDSADSGGLWGVERGSKANTLSFQRSSGNRLCLLVGQLALMQNQFDASHTLLDLEEKKINELLFSANTQPPQTLPRRSLKSTRARFALFDHTIDAASWKTAIRR
jgi:hypothetical protein